MSKVRGGLFNEGIVDRLGSVGLRFGDIDGVGRGTRMLWSRALSFQNRRKTSS